MIAPAHDVAYPEPGVDYTRCGECNPLDGEPQVADTTRCEICGCEVR